MDTTIPSRTPSVEPIAVDGDKLYEAIRKNNTQAVADFIHNAGIDATFAFDLDAETGTYMANCSVLLASIVAENEQMALYALERGANVLVADYNIDFTGDYHEVHPFIAAAAKKQVDVVKILWEQGVSLDTTLRGGSDMGQYRRTLADVIVNAPDIVEFLEASGLHSVVEAANDNEKPAARTASAKLR
jgi:hypothetical protein